MCRKEDRIIDALEPVLNQHRLIVDRSVMSGTLSPTPTLPRKNDSCICSSTKCHVCAEKKELLNMMTDLIALAQGVKYYTDAMAISAYEQMKIDRQEDWKDMNQAWLDDPQQAVNHMAFGMDLKQDKKLDSSMDLRDISSGSRPNESMYKGAGRVDLLLRGRELVVKTTPSSFTRQR